MYATQSSFAVWKLKLDLLLSESPDYPKADDLLSPHICPISNRNTNSLCTIFKDMKIDARKFVVDPNSVNEDDEEILYDWDDFDQFCDFYIPL